MTGAADEQHKAIDMPGLRSKSPTTVPQLNRNHINT